MRLIMTLNRVLHLPYQMLGLPRKKSLANLLMSGYVAKITCHSAEVATTDTVSVVQSAMEWPEAEAKRVELGVKD